MTRKAAQEYRVYENKHLLVSYLRKILEDKDTLAFFQLSGTLIQAGTIITRGEALAKT